MQCMDGVEYIERELEEIFRKGMTMCHTQLDSHQHFSIGRARFLLTCYGRYV